MRKRKPRRRKGPPPPKKPSQVATLAAIAKSFGPALSRKRQEALRSRGRRTPIAVIERIAELTEQHGTIVGHRFDAAAARAALARVKEVRAMAKIARLLSRRAESEAVRTFVLAADRTMAATVYLSRVVRLPEGAAFRDANAEVRAMIRAKRNGR